MFNKMHRFLMVSIESSRMPPFPLVSLQMMIDGSFNSKDLMMVVNDEFFEVYCQN